MVEKGAFAEHVCVVALGIGLDGTKYPLVIEDGSTESATLVRSLNVGLRERGLDLAKPALDGRRRCVGHSWTCSSVR